MQAYLSLVAGALLSYNLVLPSVWIAFLFFFSPSPFIHVGPSLVPQITTMTTGRTIHPLPSRDAISAAAVGRVLLRKRER